MRAFVYALLLGASTALPAQTPALGPEFQVNAHTTQHQLFPGVASDAAGNFTAVWSGAGPENTFGVYVRRFDRFGVPLGPDLPVDTGLGANGGVIAANAAGEFVVAWQNYRYGYKSDVFARRYDSAGNPASPPVMVNTYVAGYQTNFRVDMDPAGNFVVVWNSRGPGWFAGRYLRPAFRLVRRQAGQRVSGQHLHDRSPVGPRHLHEPSR